MTKILLVDFENVQNVDLEKVPDDVYVLFVLGAKQTKLPTELARKAHPMGRRFEYIPINDMAPNAVDFCIAYYLGRALAQDPQAECVILSKDKKGFDPLVKYLTNEKGFAVRRVNTQKEAFPVALAKSPLAKGAVTKAALEPFQKLLRLLAKEKVLPKKRKGLEGKIKSWFEKLPEEERARLMGRLLAERYVNEDEKGGLMYLVKIKQSA